MKTAVRLLSLVSLSALLTACGGGGAGGSGGSTSYGALKSPKFVDAPVIGLYYYRSSISSDGVAEEDVAETRSGGVFDCLTGETVTFTLSKLNRGADLGSITCGSNEVFPIDLDKVDGDQQLAQLVALLLHHTAVGFAGSLLPATQPLVLDSAEMARYASGGSAGNLNFQNSNCRTGSADITLCPIFGIISDIKIARLGGGAYDDLTFNSLLADAQAHLDESVEIVEEAAQVGNASVPTEQELIDFIVANGVEDVQGTHTQYCMNMNDSSDNAYSLFINGSKYAHQDGINVFQACTITVSNHPSVEVGLTSSIANSESTYVGKFFKKSNGDVRFAQNCPSSDATFANLINGVCDGDAINP